MTITTDYNPQSVRLCLKENENDMPEVMQERMIHIILILQGRRSWEKEIFVMPLPTIILKACV